MVELHGYRPRRIMVPFPLRERHSRPRFVLHNEPWLRPRVARQNDLADCRTVVAAEVEFLKRVEHPIAGVTAADDATQEAQDTRHLSERHAHRKPREPACLAPL